MLPPPKFRTSSSRLPSLGSYSNGVDRVSTRSKAPLLAVDNAHCPLKTVVLSAPTLAANVVLRASGAAFVVDRSICSVPVVPVNGSSVGSARNAIWEITQRPGENSPAPYTCWKRIVLTPVDLGLNGNTLALFPLVVACALGTTTVTGTCARADVPHDNTTRSRRTGGSAACTAD